MSINVHNSSNSAGYIQSMPTSFAGHIQDSSKRDHKGSLVDPTPTFDLEPKDKSGIEYPKMSQELQEAYLIENFKRETATLMASVKDRLELMPIYQSKAKEISERLKESEKQTKQDHERLSENHQLKIKENDDNYQEWIKRRNDRLKFNNEAMDKIKSEIKSKIKNLENDKLRDRKLFFDKLKSLSSTAEQLHQKIRNPKFKHEEEKINPEFRLDSGDIYERKSAIEANLIEEYNNLDSDYEKVIAGLVKQLDEVSRLQTASVKQHKIDCDNRRSEHYETKNKQYQNYFASQDTIENKKLLEKRRSESLGRELNTLMEIYIEKFNQKNIEALKKQNEDKLQNNLEFIIRMGIEDRSRTPYSNKLEEESLESNTDPNSQNAIKDHNSGQRDALLTRISEDEIEEVTEKFKGSLERDTDPNSQNAIKDHNSGQRDALLTRISEDEATRSSGIRASAGLRRSKMRIDL